MAIGYSGMLIAAHVIKAKWLDTEEENNNNNAAFGNLKEKQNWQYQLEQKQWQASKLRQKRLKYVK